MRVLAGMSLCLAVAVSSPASAKAGPADHAGQLRQELQALVNDRQLPGALAIVRQRGKTLAHVRVGFQDVESARRLEDDAVFRLYSMTKPITSVAIMMLAEDGRVALDAPVSHYLPEFANVRVYDSGSGDALTTVGSSRPITIADLLLHRSGIIYHFTGNSPVHAWYRAHGVARETLVGANQLAIPAAASLKELIGRIAQAPLAHQPGTRFSYGLSTTVLGAVIERVTDETLDSFFKRRIFDPLKMHDTMFVVTDAALPRFVTTYSATPQGIRVVETPQTSEYRDPKRLRDAGGGLVGTARDYMHFAEMLAGRGVWRGKRLLSTDSINAMFMPRLRTGGKGSEDSGFGFGLAIGDAASDAANFLPIGAGSWGGSANTFFFANPDTGVAAVLMTQVLTPPPFITRTELFRQTLTRAAKALARPQPRNKSVRR